MLSSRASIFLSDNLARWMYEQSLAGEDCLWCMLLSLCSSGYQRVSTVPVLFAQRVRFACMDVYPLAVIGPPSKEVIDVLSQGMSILFRLALLEVRIGDSNGFRTSESVAYCAVSGCMLGKIVPVVEPAVKLLGVRWCGLLCSALLCSVLLCSALL